MDFEYLDPTILDNIKKRYGIIGSSPKTNNALKQLLKAAPTELNILITGETGTGKEVFAHAVHGLSNRHKNQFVSVNCAAIPENLLESELFGHERGAFTGAVEKRTGFFESADKGTIFLDEIGEMPIGTQVKLLRVLESGNYSRLGSSQMRKVDVRVIAATNRELVERVREGEFRQDLYFRLKAVHIELPSLRERPDDIPELVEHFADITTKKVGIRFEGISVDAMNMLKSMHWPGNIRELKNLVETIITLEKGEYITSEMLIRYMPRALPAYESSSLAPEKSLVTMPREEFSGGSTGPEFALIFRTLLELKHEIGDMRIDVHDMKAAVKKMNDQINTTPYEEVSDEREGKDIFEEIEDLNISVMEKRMIMESLRRSNGNRRAAARQLGISERTLYRKLSDYGLS